MSRRTHYAEKFKNLDRMPMPVFVTDADGIVLYKNSLAASNYTFRVGGNISGYADSENFNTVRQLALKGIPSTVVLKTDLWACVCIVTPKEIDGERIYIYSSIPYAYDFIDTAVQISSRTRDEKESYFVELENQITALLESSENEFDGISENEIRNLKKNALKLMRLEKRLRDRLLGAGTLQGYGFVSKSPRDCLRSVELCSFAQQMTKNINLLSAVIGFSLVYIPIRDYSICRCNSYDLAKLFTYISVFCLKFGEKRDISVTVEEEAGDSLLTFKPKIRISTLDNSASFDMNYISACASKIGFYVETDTSGEFAECIKIRIPSKEYGGVRSMSSESYLFDVTEAFIRNVFVDAEDFIGELSRDKQ